MNAIVYKYTIHPGLGTTIKLPKGARVLSADVQHDEVRIWALCDGLVAETEDRLFLALPTGVGAALLPEMELKFINTVLFPGGHLVFHVFELLKP